MCHCHQAHQEEEGTQPGTLNGGVGGLGMRVGGRCNLNSHLPHRPGSAPFGGCSSSRNGSCWELRGKTSTLARRFCPISQTAHNTLGILSWCFPDVLIPKCLTFILPSSTFFFLSCQASHLTQLPPPYQPSLRIPHPNAHMSSPLSLVSPLPPQLLKYSQVLPLTPFLVLKYSQFMGLWLRWLNSWYANTSHRPSWFCWAMQTKGFFILQLITLKEQHGQVFCT